ncbi:MAG: hypothetical protein MZU97_24660 [Bacillus subtilis]|nr:hypothetical protein [Bacillus subtilis]
MDERQQEPLHAARLKTEYQSVYANYLVKYLDGHAAEGIEIDYLSIQNEPRYASWQLSRHALGPLLDDIVHQRLPRSADRAMAESAREDHDLGPQRRRQRRLSTSNCPFQVLRNATRRPLRRRDRRALLLRRRRSRCRNMSKCSTTTIRTSKSS